MPYLFAILIFIAVLSVACKSPKNAGDTTSNRTVSATLIGATNKPTARPVNALTGRIVGVREPLRFVIVDFTNSRMPQLDQRLNVYRLDQKVAELKISGPYLGTTVAADITAGQVLEGDLVRDR
jgi:hypothetical protein